MKKMLLLGFVAAISLNADAVINESLDFTDGCGNEDTKKEVVAKKKVVKEKKSGITIKTKKSNKKPVDQIEEALDFGDGCGNDEH